MRRLSLLASSARLASGAGPARLVARQAPICPCLRARASSSSAKRVLVPDGCTAQRLARDVKMPLAELLEHANALSDERVRKDSVLSADVIELIGLESGVALQFESEARDVRRRPLLPPEELAKLPVRPPVVTLMGHVDHGKTSMLDAFRGSALAAAEAGGITQTISAFQVDSGTGQAATFIDTPGHEFFSAMRHRGTVATDIVLLIVALDAGVQPTTVQAIELAKEMGVPIIVAANKVDRYGNAERLPQLQQQLLANGLHPEELSGDVPVIAVSATQRLHLDTLRDTLQLHAEMLELHAEDVRRATPHRAAPRRATPRHAAPRRTPPHAAARHTTPHTRRSSPGHTLPGPRTSRQAPVPGLPLTRAASPWTDGPGGGRGP